ncbi:MAG: hypothetical protein BGO09_11360 [Bacteroidetes bacterium 47-18]|nr:MAG: hypothetical protein BGO09_11360 [Bacteroidetes bacterium 47-18]
MYYARPQPLWLQYLTENLYISRMGRRCPGTMPEMPGNGPGNPFRKVKIRRDRVLQMPECINTT